MTFPGEHRLRRTLENGLRVVTAAHGSTPVFTAVLAVEAGSRYETDAEAGLAALTAASLVEGTLRRNSDELAEAIDSLGASLDVVSGYEVAALSIRGPEEALDDALAVLREVVSEPVFADHEVDEARRTQVAEIAEDEEDPYCVCRRALFDAVFGAHPRHRPSYGTSETLERLSAADVKRFHDAVYGPSRAVLALAGRFVSATGTDDAAAKAAAAFADWTADVPPPRPLGSPLPSEGGVRAVEMDREQMHVGIGQLGVRRADPDVYALRVLEVILGDGAGFESRLASRLREREGLAYIVESELTATAGLDPGVVCAYTATAPDRAAEAAAAMREELSRVLDEAPAPDELEGAIAYLTGGHLADRETVESTASRMAAIERYGLGLDYDERYTSIIRSVTGDDVLAAARRNLDPHRLWYVLVGPGADEMKETMRL